MNISLQAFRRREYHQDSRPSIRTLRTRVRDGKLPGGYIDCKGRYWVNLDVYRKAKSIDNRIKQLVGEDAMLQAALG